MPQLKELKEENEITYVHEVNCIGASDGELYLSHEGGTVVFNTTTLLADLPTIVRLVKREYAQELERIINDLKHGE
tara:strand:- start:3268 stop:3495 length:228 start_codon:yes stop_codon:yes gene_type:complete